MFKLTEGDYNESAQYSLMLRDSIANCSKVVGTSTSTYAPSVLGILISNLLAKDQYHLIRRIGLSSKQILKSVDEVTAIWFPLTFTISVDSDGYLLTLPLLKSTIINIVVDWGDGSVLQTFSYVHGEQPNNKRPNVSHQYAKSANGCNEIYRVRIYPNENSTLKVIDEVTGSPVYLDQFGCWGLDWSTNVRSFESLGRLGIYSLDDLFSRRSDLPGDIPDIAGLDVSNIRSMRNLFAFWKEFNQSIENWDVSKVENMGGMFYECVCFNKPIGDWNVSNVCDMEFMFSGASSFNQQIGKWSTSKVQDMTAMFANATSFNQPIGNWDTSNVREMSHMFGFATTFNQVIGQWDVSQVIRAVFMFHGATSFVQSIQKWEFSTTADTTQMFDPWRVIHGQGGLRSETLFD